MTRTAELYQTSLHPLTAVVEAVTPTEWDAPSPCRGWSARDVVRHLVDTQREMLSGHRVDLGDAPDLDADPAFAWRVHTERVLEALADEGLTGRAYDGHFGPTTVGATLEQFYVWDMYVHRWDLARAVDLNDTIPDIDIEQAEATLLLLHDKMGESMRGPTAFGPEVPAPEGADRQTKLLAFLGRMS